MFVGVGTRGALKYSGQLGKCSKWAFLEEQQLIRVPLVHVHISYLLGEEAPCALCRGSGGESCAVIPKDK